MMKYVMTAVQEKHTQIQALPTEHQVIRFTKWLGPLIGRTVPVFTTGHSRYCKKKEKKILSAKVYSQ